MMESSVAALTLLLCVWAISPQHDSKVLFGALLILFASSSSSFLLSSPRLPSIPAALSQEEASVLAVLGAVSLIPMFRLNRLGGLLCFYSALEVQANSSNNNWWWLIVCSACLASFKDCAQFFTALVCLDYRTDYALLFVLLFTLGEPYLFAPAYEILFAVLLSLSALVLVDPLLLGQNNTQNNNNYDYDHATTMAMVFQLAVFYRCTNKTQTTFRQLQQIGGVLVGSFCFFYFSDSALARTSFPLSLTLASLLFQTSSLPSFLLATTTMTTTTKNDPTTAPTATDTILSVETRVHPHTCELSHQVVSSLLRIPHNNTTSTPTNGKALFYHSTLCFNLVQALRDLLPKVRNLTEWKAREAMLLKGRSSRRLVQLHEEVNRLTRLLEDMEAEWDRVSTATLQVLHSRNNEDEEQWIKITSERRMQLTKKSKQNTTQQPQEDQQPLNTPPSVVIMDEDESRIETAAANGTASGSIGKRRSFLSLLKREASSSGPSPSSASSSSGRRRLLFFKKKE